MNLGQAIVFGFGMFALGFSIGFFYLKHKFESHVSGVFDFENGDFSDLEDLGDEVVAND